jgi:hypothetical protein
LKPIRALDTPNASQLFEFFVCFLNLSEPPKQTQCKPSQLFKFALTNQDSPSQPEPLGSQPKPSQLFEFCLNLSGGPNPMPS